MSINYRKLTRDKKLTIQQQNQETILKKKFILKKSNLVLNFVTVLYLNLDLTAILLQLELR